ncbi:MAG: hypothetical protein HC794_00375 [Nitrospiraceae bacterium]|nr:hypothetical protein [Nitrospiraceae bacterium]
MNGIQASGGKLSPEDFGSLLNPGYMRDGTKIIAERTLAQDATGVSTSLRLVNKENNSFHYALEQSLTYETFSDIVHDILINTPNEEANSTVLDAYAWLVAESHKQKDLSWSAFKDTRSFVEEMLEGLTGDDDDGARPMNTTKLPAWRRWLVFLGLCESLPGLTNAPLWHFSPARRIKKELQCANVPEGQIFTGSELLRTIANRCPYLDGGRKYQNACSKMGYVHGQRELSAALTVGLRELEAEEVLEFGLLGDSSDALLMVPDPTLRTNSFNRVTIRAFSK